MTRVDANVRRTPARAVACGGLFWRANARLRARGAFFRDLRYVLLISSLGGLANALPYVPPDDSTVLAEVAPGTGHSELATRQIASARLDIALSLARLYIQQSRASGDLRFLGYSEAVLTPWVGPGTDSADALILHATVLQSRHDFKQALRVLERARTLRADDAQAWLTSATILRVLGRYDEASAACEQVAVRGNPAVVELCKQGIRALTGRLQSAYTAVSRLDPSGMPEEERAWRDSELGEMAVRLGRDDEAERWFEHGIRSSPTDFYLRAAFADLLLRNGRAPEVLVLLKGQDTLEPLLLRIAIAQKRVHDPGLQHSSLRLTAAFAAESQRGDGVHRREEARFLLDVRNDPAAALAAAQENWKTQHEAEDALVLIDAARAARTPAAAAVAEAFVKENRVQDVRIAAAMAVRS